MKVYIDTNILIDLVCSREEFLSDAQSLFSLGYAGKIQLSLSALSFINAVYISRKYRFPIQAVKQSLLSIASFTEPAIKKIIKIQIFRYIRPMNF